MVKVREYVKENWGSPFLIGFMVLLLIVAVLFSSGSSILADTVAVNAYYILAIGVVLQLICTFRVRKKINEVQVV
jgi:hypothetical protein